MTLNVKLINCGNRDGDTLTVEQIDRDGNVTRTQRLTRGAVINLSTGYAFRLAGEHVADDEYVGEPTVTVTDPPRAAR